MNTYKAYKLRIYPTDLQRELIEKTNLDWHHACPGGDVMMTGTIGLIKTIEWNE